MIISYKQFQQNRFLILESRFKETFWFRITYNELLNLMETGEISTAGSLFLVTKDSDNSESYDDEFLLPITLYLDKEKTIKFLEDNNYKTSISKNSDFFKESDENFDDLNNEETSEEIPEEETPNTSDVEEEVPEEDTEETSDDIEEEIPDEITINEHKFKLDPEIIIGMEIFLKKLENLLDNEFNKLLSQLKLKNKFSNMNDIDKRKKLQDIFVEKIDTYCASNNIIKNYIKD